MQVLSIDMQDGIQDAAWMQKYIHYTSISFHEKLALRKAHSNVRAHFIAEGMGGKCDKMLVFHY